MALKRSLNTRCSDKDMEENWKKSNNLVYFCFRSNRNCELNPSACIEKILRENVLSERRRMVMQLHNSSKGLGGSFQILQIPWRSPLEGPLEENLEAPGFPAKAPPALDFYSKHLIVIMLIWLGVRILRVLFFFPPGTTWRLEGKTWRLQVLWTA